MSDTSCCQVEFSSAFNSGVVFLLCLLLSIIKCLFSVAVATLGAPALFLSTFGWVSSCLYSKYWTPSWEIFNFFAICLWEESTLNKFQFLPSPQYLPALILLFWSNYFNIKKWKSSIKTQLKRYSLFFLKQRQLCFAPN